MIPSILVLFVSAFVGSSQLLTPVYEETYP